MKYETQRKLEWVLKCMAILFVSSMLLSIVWGFWYAFHTREGVPSLADVESYTHLRFPQGTRVVGSYYAGARDYEYCVVLEFDARQTDSFLKPLRNPEVYLSRKERQGICNSKFVYGKPTPAWWNPDSQTKFISAGMGGVTKRVFLLIGLDDSNKRKVYLYANDF